MIKIPDNIKKEYHNCYPNLTNRGVDLIFFSFEEFILLHNGSDEHFEMLSSDVDSLWHFLIIYYPNYLNVYTKILCGRTLSHKTNLVPKNGNDKDVKRTVAKYRDLGLSLPRDKGKATPLDIDQCMASGELIYQGQLLTVQTDFGEVGQDCLPQTQKEVHMSSCGTSTTTTYSSTSDSSSRKSSCYSKSSCHSSSCSSSSCSSSSCGSSCSSS